MDFIPLGQNQKKKIIKDAKKMKSKDFLQKNPLVLFFSLVKLWIVKTVWGTILMIHSFASILVLLIC